MELELKDGKGGRYYIYADGEYIASVSPEVWYTLPDRLREDPGEEEIAELKNEITARKAYSSALRIVTARAHSEKELRVKLGKKYPSGAVDAAIARCRDAGFINDREFASLYARELAEKKRYGVMRIRQELAARGVEREDVEDALDMPDVDFSANIRYIIESRYYDCLDSEKGRRKLFAALNRSGYGYDEIKEVLSDLDEEEV